MPLGLQRDLKSHLEVQCVPIDGLTSKYAKKERVGPNRAVYDFI